MCKMSTYYNYSKSNQKQEYTRKCALVVHADGEGIAVPLIDE